MYGSTFIWYQIQIFAQLKIPRDKANLLPGCLIFTVLSHFSRLEPRTTYLNIFSTASSEKKSISRQKMPTRWKTRTLVTPTPAPHSSTHTSSHTPRHTQFFVFLFNSPNFYFGIPVSLFLGISLSHSLFLSITYSFLFFSPFLSLCFQSLTHSLSSLSFCLSLTHTDLLSRWI